MSNLPRVPAKIFDDFLHSLEIDEQDLELLAKQSGWQQREPRKITAAGLLSALCLEAIQEEASFNDLSSGLGLASDEKGPTHQ